MNWKSLLTAFLFALALSADAFSVAVSEGLLFKGIKKREKVFIAATFGLFQGLFPLAGFFLIELIETIIDASMAKTVSAVFSLIITYISFALLLFLGSKMIVSSIKEMKKEKEERQEKVFSVKEVLVMGVATAIDALASGIAFHNENADGVAFSDNATIFLHVGIIAIVTFLLSLLGVSFGGQIRKLFKGKIEVTGIVAGGILIALSAWVLVSHYLGI